MTWGGSEGVLICSAAAVCTSLWSYPSKSAGLLQPRFLEFQENFKVIADLSAVSRSQALLNREVEGTRSQDTGTLQIPTLKMGILHKNIRHSNYIFNAHSQP